MKPKIKLLLEGADSSQLLEIIDILSEKYKQLPEEIEFILSPRNIKNPQSYYNKLVKKAIDTNSWSKFPNKGVKGLEEMLVKLELFQKMGNVLEANKLGLAIQGILDRCKKKYNTQNVDELLQVQEKLESIL